MSSLHRMSYAKHLGGVYAALRDGVLTRYLPTGPEKSELAAEEIPGVLRDVFGADPALYLEAREVRLRHVPKDRVL